MSNDEANMNEMFRSRRRAVRRPPPRNGLRRFHLNNSNGESNNNNASSTSSNSTNSAIDRLASVGQALIDAEKVVGVAAFEKTTGLVLQNGHSYIASYEDWRIGAGARLSLIDMNFTNESVGYINRAGNFERELIGSEYDGSIPADVSGGYKFKKLIRGIGESYLGLTDDNRLVNIGERHANIPALETTPVLTAAAWKGTYENPGFAVVVYADGSVTQYGDITAEGSGHVEAKPADLLLKDVACGDGFCVGITNEDHLFAWGNYVKNADGSSDILQKIIDGVTYTPRKVVCGYYNLVVIDTENNLHVYELLAGEGVVLDGSETEIPEPYKSIKVLDVAAAHVHFVAITDQHKAYVSNFDFSKVYPGDDILTYYNLPPKYTDSRVVDDRRDRVFRINCNEGVSTAVTNDGYVYVWGNAGESAQATRIQEYPDFESQVVKVIATNSECAALLDTGYVQYWSNDGGEVMKLPEDKTYSDIVAGFDYFIGLGDDHELYKNKLLRGAGGRELALPLGPFKKIFSNKTGVCVFVREDNSLVVFIVGSTVYGPNTHELAGTHDFDTMAIYEGYDYLQFAATVVDTGEVKLWGKFNTIAGFPTTSLGVTQCYGGIAAINSENSQLYVATITPLGGVRVGPAFDHNLRLSGVEGGPSHIVCLTEDKYVVSINYSDSSIGGIIADSAHTATPIPIVDPNYRHETDLFYQQQVNADEDEDADGKEDEDYEDGNNYNEGSYNRNYYNNPYGYNPYGYQPPARRRLSFGRAIGEFFTDDVDLRADKTVIEPALTKLADVDELPRPDDKNLYDFSSGTDYDTYGEYLEEEQADAIVFKIGDKLMGFSKSRLAAAIQDGSIIFYECRKVFAYDPDNGEMGTFEPHDIKRNAFVMLTLNGNFFIKRDDLIRLVYSTHQFFQLEASTTTVPVTASRAAALLGGPIVSAKHCQDGTSINLHTIKPIRFINPVRRAAEAAAAVPEMKVIVTRGNDSVSIDISGNVPVGEIRAKYAAIKGVDLSRVKLIAPGRFPKNTNVAKPGDRFMAIIKNVPANNAPAPAPAPPNNDGPDNNAREDQRRAAVIRNNPALAWNLGYGGRRKTRRSQKGAGRTRKIRGNIPSLF